MKNKGWRRACKGAGGVLQSVSRLHGPLLYLLELGRRRVGLSQMTFFAPRLSAPCKQLDYCTGCISWMGLGLEEDKTAAGFARQRQNYVARSHGGWGVTLAAFIGPCLPRAH